MFDKGFFGDLFDFNGDGKLDMFEKAADFGLLCQIMEDEEDDDDEEEDDGEY